MDKRRKVAEIMLGPTGVVRTLIDYGIQWLPREAHRLADRLGQRLHAATYRAWKRERDRALARRGCDADD